MSDRRAMYNLDEVWKDIDGFEGIYQVSNKGRVRTFRQKDGYVGYKIADEPKEMSLIPHGEGYLYVTLVKDGKRHNRYVHRLVASAFIGEIPSGYVVNHIDYDKSNNEADNLEIITQQKNVRYSVHKMRKPKARNGDYYIRYRSSKYEVTIQKHHIGIYETIDEARKARDEYIDTINYY